MRRKKYLRPRAKVVMVGTMLPLAVSSLTGSTESFNEEDGNEMTEIFGEEKGEWN